MRETLPKPKPSRWLLLPPAILAPILTLPGKPPHASFFDVAMVMLFSFLFVGAIVYAGYFGFRIFVGLFFNNQQR